MQLEAQNIMLDLESLGTRPGAIITSIGAVQFDENGLGETFEINIDPKDAAGHGLTMDPSTVNWWLKQPMQARMTMTDRQVGLVTALDLFAAWVRDYGSDTTVWGNGVGFDNALLSEAYRLTGKELPWKWWNDRCFRTLKNLHPDVPRVIPTLAHSALQDALAQAKQALTIFGVNKE